MNLADTIEINARRKPHHPAIIERTGEVISYREYGDLVALWASAFKKMSLTPGDIIGLNLKDTVEHLIALYAIARCGAVILPMDWRWTAIEKQRIVNFFGAKAVLSEPDDLFLSEPGSWKNIIVDQNWKEGIQELEPLKNAPRSADKGLLLALSSGTTGTPKGPLITHEQFLARFLIYLITIGFSERDRYLCATPLYFGGCRGYAMCTLYAGGTVLLHPPPYKPEALLTYANHFCATRLFLVPTLLRRLLMLEGGSKEAPLFETLELLFSTGAVLHAEEREELMRRFSPKYLNFYGSTDGGGCSALLWDDPKEVAASVGRPVFGATLEIVDDNDKPLKIGEVGRIRYHHPGTANGYFNDASGSKTAFRDGWYFPGDLGWINDEGFLFLAGRESDMIIRGGINIYPAEIEYVLSLHKEIFEASVVAWPSKEFGEEIAAFAVLKKSSQVTSEQLIEYCRKKMAPYKIPREIFLIDNLPKSGVGKVLKKELVNRLPRP